MDVSIVGSGYVGTTVAACLADIGHDVVAIDVDEGTVDAINRGEAPIHEPGLDGLVSAWGGDRLTATTDYGALTDTDLTMLALPTPSQDDGSIDLGAMEAGARSVGEALAGGEGYHLVVVKSTVIPGTTEDVLEPIVADASGRTSGEDLGVTVNPEFQREGSAVEDFMEPDKIVLGTDDDDRGLDRLAELYEPIVLEWDVPVVETGRREAEMIKYANNAFLAAKVSLINDIGNVCKAYGVDAYEVAEAIGLDHRIGAAFLRSGVGWGGSCFPKDLDASSAWRSSRAPTTFAIPGRSRSSRACKHAGRRSSRTTPWPTTPCKSGSPTSSTSTLPPMRSKTPSEPSSSRTGRSSPHSTPSSIGWPARSWSTAAGSSPDARG